MYDRPETRPALEALWSHMRRRLLADSIAAPEHLETPVDLWTFWQAPDLLIGQTCGLPYRARLHTNVALLGAPEHQLPGCPPGHYRSVLVVGATDQRANPADFAGARVAVNDPLSQSGWAALADWAARHRVALGPAHLTGSHRASAQAVADGQMELAAIDAVTWRMITRWDACAAGLRVIGQTSPTPALPFITARGALAPVLMRALLAAIGELRQSARDCLDLHGLVAVQPAAYLNLPLPPVLPVRHPDATGRRNDEAAHRGPLPRRG